MHPLSIQPVRKICLTGLIAATMLSLWLALMPLPVYAQGPVVNTALDENDSDCNDGDCSLRDAIQTAVAGETVTFDNSYTIYLSSTLLITKVLTIDGTGRSITISGDTGNDGSRDVRVFDINAGAVVTLSHLNIMSGKAPRGGGILNAGTLLVSNSTISNNLATGNLGQGGGGIYNSGALTVSASTIANNLATGAGTDGGGIDNDSGSLTITDSAISGNSASGSSGRGGGIDFSGTALTIDNTTISGNSAGQLGGGIYKPSTDAKIINSLFFNNASGADGGGFYGSALITNTMFISNSARTGGGLYSSNNNPLTVTHGIFTQNSAIDGGAIGTAGEITLLNSAFYNNSASNNGGGLYDESDWLTLKNSTFYSNTATNQGGGIYLLGANNPAITMTNLTLSHNTAITGGGLYHEASASIALRNTIIANSMGGDCFNVDVIQINVNTLVEDGSCNQGTLTFTGFISGDPQLDALADNDGLSAGLTTSPQVIQTMALLPDSPAIDAGDDATCEPSDQRGQSREGTCDIGAFEWQGQGSEVYLPLVIKN